MRRLVALVVTLLLVFTSAQDPASARRPLEGFGVDAKGRVTVMVPTTRSSTPVVVRVTSAGVLDPSFSGDGVLRPPLMGKQVKLAVQRGGAVVVGGNRGKKVVLRRYRPDGSPDRNFGDRGSALLTYGGPIEGVLRQPDGKIIALSTRSCSPDSCGYLYRNLEVQRFSPGGKLLHEYLLSQESWNLQAAGMDPRGGFVVTGNIWDLEYQTYDRFRPSGAFAGSIHRDVKMTLGNEDWEEEVEAGVSDLAIDARGRLVLAPGYGAEIWRRNPNGSTDRAFGERGRVVCGRAPGSTDVFGPRPAFEDVEVAPDGKLVAAGGPGECSLVRYLGDGTPDPSFGGDGKIDVEPAGMPPPQALGLLPDGGVIVAGWHPGSSSIRLARYTAEGVLDPSFGSGGLASVAVVAPG